MLNKPGLIVNNKLILEMSLLRKDFQQLNTTLLTTVNKLDTIVDTTNTNILKISNGLELKISEDYESYINGLKYKKININAEKEPALGQFVPDTSILGIKRIVVLENKNYTYIKIPGEDEGKGCSIEARDRIFVFKDSIPDFSFDIIYKNITDVREFDKWIKVKE